MTVLVGIILFWALLYGPGQNTHATVASPGPAKLLFSSGFEGSTTLSSPGDCYGTGCWQNITGLDASTGFDWPPKIWGGGRIRLQLIADASVDATTVGDYIFNEIQTVTGHNGKPTRALYQRMSRSGCCGTNSQGGRPAQNAFTLQPVGETSDLYVSYWLKYQPDLAQSLKPPNWRVVFEWKTRSDYRVIASVVTWGLDANRVNVPLSWEIIGDNAAQSLPYKRFWDEYNTTVPVPVGEWFKFEAFWHRTSGNDGRVWMAVNGRPIVDHRGPNIGVYKAPIDRIMMPNLYSGGAYPIYQWVDDVQIWDGFPPDAAHH